jgi:hypothetical protein
MPDWLTEARSTLAAVSGMPPERFELDESTKATLLDLARVAAHESGDRRNAPLLCYLAGLAANGTDLETIAAALRRA